jgi:hypothetical protein
MTQALHHGTGCFESGRAVRGEEPRYKDWLTPVYG